MHITLPAYDALADAYTYARSLATAESVTPERRAQWAQLADGIDRLVATLPASMRDEITEAIRARV